MQLPFTAVVLRERLRKTQKRNDAVPAPGGKPRAQKKDFEWKKERRSVTICDKVASALQKEPRGMVH